jgi:2,4-dienoyl-CoA reductase-like NADH-dependent reductase (Old Yellow Enzyme family)/thioredoxin reductase
MKKLVHLFLPGTIGKLAVKNRIVQAPMGTYSYDEDGVPSQQTIDYFARRAEGGAGLIICHSGRVSRESRVLGMPCLFEDRHVPMLARIAKAIHEGGAKCALQMNHSGKVVIDAGVNGMEVRQSYHIGPSTIGYFNDHSDVRELSAKDIHRLVELFSDGARRVKEAGFDMVELHAAHGYLMSSFLSPLTNRRADEYGGSPQNRARFVCDILRRIRDKAGPDFPVSVRFNGADLISSGTVIDDSLIHACMFEDAGASMLHVSAGTHKNTEVQMLSYLWPDAYLSDLAFQVKKAVGIPVCTVGKLGNPLVAEELLEHHKADFVALARPFLADPDWPRKVEEGRIDEINRCLYCNNCVDRLGSKTREEKRLFCTVNPSLFREREYAISKVAEPKKVIVVGGGLAGMQAAKTAAERGHSVTLYEAGEALGGMWNIASIQPGKEMYKNLTRQLANGLVTAGVKVVLNRKVDGPFIIGQKPDSVIVATGAKPINPIIPGADGKNVVQAVDIFLGKAEAGENVIVVGGRWLGMEAACFLREKGKNVSLFTLKRLGENGKKLEENIYRTLRNRMIETGVQVFPHTPVKEIRSDGVFADDDGNMLWLHADTVVLAAGYEAEDELLKQLPGAIPATFSAGDCNGPRDALDAIREGMEVGLKV